MERPNDDNAERDQKIGLVHSKLSALSNAITERFANLYGEALDRALDKSLSELNEVEARIRRGESPWFTS